MQISPFPSASRSISPKIIAVVVTPPPPIKITAQRESLWTETKKSWLRSKVRRSLASSAIRPGAGWQRARRLFSVCVTLDFIAAVASSGRVHHSVSACLPASFLPASFFERSASKKRRHLTHAYAATQNPTLGVATCSPPPCSRLRRRWWAFYRPPDGLERLPSQTGNWTLRGVPKR